MLRASVLAGHLQRNCVDAADVDDVSDDDGDDGDDGDDDGDADTNSDVAVDG